MPILVFLEQTVKIVFVQIQYDLNEHLDMETKQRYNILVLLYPTFVYMYLDILRFSTGKIISNKLFWLAVLIIGMYLDIYIAPNPPLIEPLRVRV